jgi:flagellar basal body rod protein FlgB
MFGGSIHSVEVEGRVHYFNKINGNYIDMTREQFENSRTPVSYEPNIEIERKAFDENGEQKRRYKLLLSRISEYLKV